MCADSCSVPVSAGVIAQTVRSSWWDLLKAGWRLWPFAHIITYGVVPIQHRCALTSFAHPLHLVTRGVAPMQHTGASCCKQPSRYMQAHWTQLVGRWRLIDHALDAARQ